MTSENETESERETERTKKKASNTYIFQEINNERKEQSECEQ